MDSDGFIRVTRTHRLCSGGRRRYRQSNETYSESIDNSSTISVQSIENIIRSASLAVCDYG